MLWWCAGRSLLSVRLFVGGATLRFATVHLESPVPGALASAPRKEQLAEVSAMLSADAHCCCFLHMHFCGVLSAFRSTPCKELSVMSTTLFAATLC